MGDEVRNANVVRIVKDGPRWLALVGPDPATGLIGRGVNPASALVDLAARCNRARWPFDPTWRPGKTGFHDA